MLSVEERRPILFYSSQIKLDLPGGFNELYSLDI